MNGYGKGKKRARRKMARILVFALLLGIAPKFAIITITSHAISGYHAPGDPDPSASASAPVGPTATATLDPTSAEAIAKAKQLLKEIEELLSIRFDYVDNFDAKLKTIKDTYGLKDDELDTNSIIKAARVVEQEGSNSYVTAYTQIITLLKDTSTDGMLETEKLSHMGFIPKVNYLISKAVGTTLNDTNFAVFKSNVEAATEALNSYYSQFGYLQGLSLFITCLGDKSDVTVNATIRDKRIVNLPGYNHVRKMYNIEMKYDETMEFCKDADNKIIVNDTNSEKLAELVQTIIDNGYDSKDTYGDSMLTYLYNGSSIKKLRDQYLHINAFRTRLKGSSQAPSTKSEIEDLGQVNALYEGLTEEEKQMVPEKDVERLTNSAASIVDVKKLTDMINGTATTPGIKYPTNDAEYVTFKEAYVNAYAAYTALLTQYGASSGVADLVPGIQDLRGDMTTVYNFLARVDGIIHTEASQMCNKYNSMNSIVTDYKNLSTVNQGRIYNYKSFYTIYEDTGTAYKLRLRVDALLLAQTADDQAEIASIRSDYEKLNNQAKLYFGSLYLDHLTALETGQYAKDINLANRVDELIAKIGVVTSNSGEKINDAERAYAQLTEYQKQLVKTYPTLVAARKAYDELKTDIGAARVTNIKTGYVYTHERIKPLPVVRVDGKVLEKGTHYAVTYANNKNVGTATVTITAIEGGGYKGSYTKTFIIVRDSVKGCGVSKLKKKYKYTGKKIKPNIKVTVNGHTLKKGTDYTLTYKNNIKVGKASIVIKGKGNYKGSRTVYFKIVKKK